MLAASSQVTRFHVEPFVKCSRCPGPRDRPGQRYCRACHAAYQRANRPKYSELSDKQRRRAIARAIAGVYQARGKLEEQPCESCGSTESIEKHHEDYAKPLEVTWLCTPCHRAHHNQGALTP